MSRVRLPSTFVVFARSAALCWLIVGAAVAAPVTIFEDTFGSDPGSNGWTETTSALFGGPPTISSTGSAAFFDAEGLFTSMAISQAISTLGYENITIEVEAFQANTSYETVGFDSDVFAITVGGSNVFQSTGVFTGVNGSAVVGAGNLDPSTSTGTIVLPASADNQANLMLEISAQTTTPDEDFFISSVRVAGELIAAVPEASSALLLGSVALGFFFWQSRRRIHRRLV